jgi:hypothetical protein
MMKKVSNAILSILITALTLSCSSDSATPAASDNSIKAKIDGVAYTATGTQISGDQNTVGFNFGSYLSSGGTGFDFSINGTATVGTYTFNTTNLTSVGRLNYRLSSEIYSSAICANSGGTLTITSKNGKTIEGTFSFTGKKVLGCAEAAKVITDGTFKITFL